MAEAILQVFRGTKEEDGTYQDYPVPLYEGMVVLDADSLLSAGTLLTLERGGCQLAWYNRIHWYTIGQFNHRTHRKSLIVDGRNFLDREELVAAGFTYEGVGR